jgi:hypothetical protein
MARLGACALLVGLLSSGTVSPASAEEPTPLRLGLMFGEPIAATVALSLNESFAVHADIGPSTSRFQRIIAAADLVYGMPEVFGGDFILWFGAGLRYSAGRDDEPNRFGFRVPAGISYFTTARATELFIFAAPGVSLVPDKRASLDGGLGIRIAL